MKRIWRMAGVVTVCMALGFATLGADIQTAYAQEGSAWRRGTDGRWMVL